MPAEGYINLTVNCYNTFNLMNGYPEREKMPLVYFCGVQYVSNQALNTFILQKRAEKLAFRHDNGSTCS